MTTAALAGIVLGLGSLAGLIAGGGGFNLEPFFVEGVHETVTPLGVDGPQWVLEYWSDLHNVFQFVRVEDIVAAAVVDGLRSQVIVEILLTTGIRSAELLSAEVSDLRMDHGVPTLTVTRKGGARARVTLPPEVWRDVRRLVGDRPSGPIVETASGRPMVHSSLYRLVKRLARRAGLPDDVAAALAPHVRHAEGSRRPDPLAHRLARPDHERDQHGVAEPLQIPDEIGRASCRERVSSPV